jgi:CheY-like chemotaxis protein
LDRADEATARREEQARDHSENGVLTLLGPKTILYVEDNDANFRLIEQLFEGHAEVTLLPAKDGRTGLQVAAEQRPDLILLDLHLPDIRGTEVLARLRRKAITRDIPVIVVTADATRSRSELLLKAGAQAYLTKPLDLERFLATVGHVLGAGSDHGHSAAA